MRDDRPVPCGYCQTPTMNEHGECGCLTDMELEIIKNARTLADLKPLLEGAYNKSEEKDHESKKGRAQVLPE